MSVGHAPSEPQWTPDMRKDEDQITAADKAEARRRIQGQVSASDAADAAATDAAGAAGGEEESSLEDSGSG
jgi:phosphatidylserine decarboxylase